MTERLGILTPSFLILLIFMQHPRCRGSGAPLARRMPTLLFAACRRNVGDFDSSWCLGTRQARGPSAHFKQGTEEARTGTIVRLRTFESMRIHPDAVIRTETPCCVHALIQSFQSRTPLPVLADRI